MKKIKLTRNKFALVDDVDFNFINSQKWQCSSLGYATTHEKGKSHTTRKRIWMHRLIVNAPLNKQVDHINRNKLDNRKTNLRLATESQNKSNRTVQRNNINSGLKGVYPNGNKWRARIQINKVKINLGSFWTKEEAALAYNRAAKIYFGKFARLNIL